MDRDERNETISGSSDQGPTEQGLTKQAPTEQGQHAGGQTDGGAAGATPPGGPYDAPWWTQPQPGTGQHAGAGPGQETGPGQWGPAPGAGGPGAADPGAGGPGYGGPGYGGAWATGSGWGWGHTGGWGGPPPGAYSSRPPRKWVSAALAAVVAAAAVLIGVGVGYGIWNGGSTPAASSSSLLPNHSRTTSGTSATSATATTSSTNGRTSTASGGPSTSAATSIANKVDPGLVDINTVLGYATEEAAGTGMVLTPTGKVLTNNHVIEQSTSISVTDLGNGKTYQASVLGYSRTNDVALIQLKNASGLQTVSLGDSSTAKVGQAVVGIGNAGGVGGTPSVAGGSVTALDQAITASDQGSLGTTTEHLTGLIESDANIQPGDSGGPLVNTTGKVLGMDTAASAAQGYSINGAATGQGYSIPINTAMSIVHQIEANKSSTSVHIGGTAFLGVYVSSTQSSTSTGPGGLFRTPTATPSASTSQSSASGGALVVGVIAGTPAKASGIAQGDVITNIGGQSVSSVNDVTKIVMQYHPGQSVKVTWTTPTTGSGSGATQSATITLASGPAD